MLAVLTRSRVTSSPVMRVFPATSTLRTVTFVPGISRLATRTFSSVWPSSRTVLELSCREPKAPVFVAAGLSVQGAFETSGISGWGLGELEQLAVPTMVTAPATTQLRTFVHRLVRVRDVPCR
jgi:hypothetical protein